MHLINRTKYIYGAHATTTLINEYVNARMGSYGPAVREVKVALFYPPRRVAKPPVNHLDTEFLRLVRLSPRVTYFRAERRVEVRFVCQGVSPRSIEGDDHLTPDEVGRLATTVSEALELIRPRFRPADKFDVQAFLRDARDALARCPAAIRRWLS